MKRFSGDSRGAAVSAESVEVSAIIVSYNTLQMTLDCLQALLHELKDFASEVLLVDNASTDGSAAAIRSAFPAVTVIENERNLGFGGGNNLAMKRATGRYLLLINTDAFPRPGAVRELIAYMDRNPRVGLVGPRLLNKDGSLQRSCYRFPSPARAWAETLWLPALFSTESKLGDYRRWAHDRERIVDWVIGACCLVRREAYKEVGGFDERFFMYAEETDWQRRFRSSGWEIGFVPSAEVTHLGGGSDPRERSTLNAHFFRSQDVYKLKHHGVAGLAVSRAADLVGLVLRLPCWLFWLLICPGDRERTFNKIKFKSRLLIRQITTWPASLPAA